MTPREFFAFAKKNKAEMVDLKFTDFLGTWQHCSFPTSTLDVNTFKDGVGFDGSSIQVGAASNVFKCSVALVEEGTVARQQVLGIHTAAEGGLSAKIIFQSLWFHAGCQGLNGMNGIRATIDQVGNNRTDRSAGMVHHPETIAFGLLHQLACSLEGKFAQLLRGDHQSRLAAKVIAYQHSIQFAFGGFVEYFAGL